MSAPEEESRSTGSFAVALAARDRSLWLLLALPLAVVLQAAGAPSTVRFAAAIAALIPLSRLLGKATEEISLRSSPAVAALLNASLGNAIELLQLDLEP